MADPRQVLKKKIADINAGGRFPVVAFELEFYLLDPDAGGDDDMPSPVGAGDRAETGPVAHVRH